MRIGYRPVVALDDDNPDGLATADGEFAPTKPDSEEDSSEADPEAGVASDPSR